jgi:hypothetical protein
MWDTLACTTAILLTYFIISIAVLENVPHDTGLQKRATFSNLNVGTAGTGDQTRATCVAGSVARRSAIHYAYRDRCRKFQKQTASNSSFPRNIIIVLPSIMLELALFGFCPPPPVLSLPDDLDLARWKPLCRVECHECGRFFFGIMEERLLDELRFSTFASE